MKISQKLAMTSGLPLLALLATSFILSHVCLVEQQRKARAHNDYALFLNVSNLVNEVQKERGRKLAACPGDEKNALDARHKAMDTGYPVNTEARPRTAYGALEGLPPLAPMPARADGFTPGIEAFFPHRKRIDERLKARHAATPPQTGEPPHATASPTVFSLAVGLFLVTAAIVLFVLARSLKGPLRQGIDSAVRGSSRLLALLFPKGALRWLHAPAAPLHAMPLDLHGMRAKHALLELQNARLTAELEYVRRKLHFFETLIDELPSPIFAKTEDARFFLFNKAYEEFFGIRREQYLGRTVMELGYLSPEERQKYQQEDLEVIRTNTMVHYETVYATNRGERASLYWSKGVAVPASGERGLVGTIVDISSQKRLEQDLARNVRELEQAQHELRLLSRTDALTGLANRRFFHERLQEGMALSNRHGVPLSLLMLDLDYFKAVNDRFGHAQGDAVLQHFAQILRDNCRNEDLAARSGGEEFILILPLTTKKKALHIAERIRRVTCDQIRLPDGSPMTVSLGVAEFQSGESPEQVVHRADEALYRAKKNGRNQVAAG